MALLNVNTTIRVADLMLLDRLAMPRQFDLSLSPNNRRPSASHFADLVFSGDHSMALLASRSTELDLTCPSKRIFLCYVVICTTSLTGARPPSVYYMKTRKSLSPLQSILYIIRSFNDSMLGSANSRLITQELKDHLSFAHPIPPSRPKMG